MSDEVLLVGSGGGTRRLPLRQAGDLRRPDAPIRSRIAYAAAHVVPHAWAENVPGAPADIDWDATLAFRHHLWSWGLGVADAMDTAQRNMGLDPRAVRELITRSAAEARSVGGRIVVGVNTDHLEQDAVSIREVTDAYLEQLRFAEEAGAGIVLMASRHLARAATGPADYVRVYREVLAAASSPVVLHWLGTAFDPVLRGYWGSVDLTEAIDTVLRIIEGDVDRVAGIKMSLLDAEAERDVRRRLPAGVRLFTGDDFHYVELIEGDGDHHSDALLGAFAAIGPLASAALQRLDVADHAGYRSILGPTEALSRRIFEAPTFHYKTGIAFLSWLNGHQPSFAMVGGFHAARSLPHLAGLLEEADACGALERPDLAAERWSRLIAAVGYGA